MATESLEVGGNSFDEVTLEELDIYARYLKAWIPASLSRSARVNEAGIYDLSCGPVLAPDGSEGSPLRAVGALRASEQNLAQRSDTTVRLVFNHGDPDCVRAHAGMDGPQVLEDDSRCLADIQYHTEPFDQLLQSLFPALRRTRTANLLFLHHFGMCESNSTRFRKLRALKRTDLLVSISANWFRQFTSTAEADYWGIASDDIDPINFSHVHRFMVSYFKSLFGNEYLIAPFSLRHGSEIYGLIFASRNPQGLEKFLKVAWHRDPYTDETNFDLYDNSAAKVRLTLLNAQKIFQFQKELMSCLESGKFLSDRDIYLHTLQRGFLARHAVETLNAFCGRHNVRFMTRAGKAARARLSQRSITRPRPMVYH